jgi:hypothetical protein
VENNKKNTEKKQKPKKNVYDYLESVAKGVKKAKPIVMMGIGVAAKVTWDAVKGKKKL